MSSVLDAPTLSELQAALRGGAGAGEAVAAVGGAARHGMDGPLGAAAAQARLGRPLADIAAHSDCRDSAVRLLLRCLAVAERSGAGAVDAVDHALAAIREQRRLSHLVEARTAQARGTAAILALLPAAVWALMVAVDVGVLGFYATPIGWMTATLAVVLAVTSWRWMQRLVRSVDDTGDGVARRRRRSTSEAEVLLAEAVVLVAVGLEAGLPPAGALREAATVAAGPVGEALAAAASRVEGGWRCDEALAGTPLEPVGRTLAAAQRWGAPAAGALRDLATQLREDRRAAVDVATERLQLALVFPTTLLTLPAFVLAVVPPLLWSTLR